MSSTPIYDELAATYLADLTPEPDEPPPPAKRSTRQPTVAEQVVARRATRSRNQPKV